MKIWKMEKRVYSTVPYSICAEFNFEREYSEV